MKSKTSTWTFAFGTISLVLIVNLALDWALQKPILLNNYFVLIGNLLVAIFIGYMLEKKEKS